MGATLNDIDQETADLINALKIKGVYGNSQFFSYLSRWRTKSTHILGFINKESTPVIGIESSLDYYLRGQDGWL